MSDPVVIGPCTLYCGDCLDILPKIEPVDVVVTSPPYLQQREYEGRCISNWNDLVPPAFISIPQTDDAQIFVNLGLVHKDGEVALYWESLISAMKDNGFRLFGWYVWDQSFGLPGDSRNGRFGNSHEFVFHFNKKSRKINKFMPTVSAGRRLSAVGMRNKNGTLRDQSHRQGIVISDNKYPDSVIRVCREQLRDGIDHPARFPVGFSDVLIKSFDGVVCDPFMGSGTTGVSCVMAGRKFIGVEIEPKYFDIACERIEKAIVQKSMQFDIDDPPNKKVELQGFDV